MANRLVLVLLLIYTARGDEQMYEQVKEAVHKPVHDSEQELVDEPVYESKQELVYEAGYQLVNEADTKDRINLEYECVDSDPIPVLLEGPSHSIVLQSQTYPSYPNSTAPSRCLWQVSALHGAQVKVTALEVELAEDCHSTSVLSMFDESDSPSRLHYPGVEARCNQRSSIPSSTSCLTSQGKLTITSTPGLRHRLLLEATPPPECPGLEAEDHCPQGPCCGEEECYCQYLLGSQPLELAPTKPGLCSYDLISAPGSQISVNFLDMEMPPQDPSQGCESWVSLEEQEEHLGSIVGRSTSKFCGHTVPNYPGPSIFTGASNFLTVRYNLPVTSVTRGHGFKAAVSAVNPLCSSQWYTHTYGDNVCHASCGESNLSPGPQEPILCPSDICEYCHPPHCRNPPQKILLLTLLQNGTDNAVSGAQVNISSSASFYPHHSDLQGEVSHTAGAAIAGLLVSVAAEGFISQQQVIEDDCENVQCQDCHVSLALFIDPVPVKNETCPDDMTYSLTVIDSSNRTVPGVQVSLILVLTNQTEGAVSNFEILVEGIVTDLAGMVTVPITVNGNYIVNLVKDGWIGQDVEIEISNCTHLDQYVVLEREPPCQATLSVHVRDPTDLPVTQAQVSVFLAGQDTLLFKPPLTTDDSGHVSQVMTPEVVRILVTAPDFFPMEVNANVTCDDPKPTVVVIIIESVPPTPKPTCYSTDSEDQIMFYLNVYDDLTGERVMEAQGNVSVKADGELFQLAEDALVGSDWSFQIERDGLYEFSVGADGYQPANSSLNVVCDINDCSSCQPSLSIFLGQELCLGNKERILRVQVKDSTTSGWLPGALVTVELMVNNGEHQSVSPHHICPNTEEGTRCEQPGPSKEACISNNCCWNHDIEECFQPEGNTGLMTDQSGLVALSLPGHGTYIVKVTRDNFISQEFETKVTTCDPATLEMAMIQEPLCSPQGVPFHIFVYDKNTGLSIPETNVRLILTSSALGPSQVEVGGNLLTDITGGVSPILYIDGTYRITAAAPGYQDLTKEISLNDSVCDIGVSISLNLSEEPGPGCDDTTGVDIVVFDLYTGASVAGVLVDVQYVNETSLAVAEGVRTDDLGGARVPVSKLGQYVATLNTGSIPPYEPASNMTNLTCCSCPASIALYLDQPHCNPVMTVSVRDNTTGLAISGARVTVLLTHSLTGPSLTMEGSVMTTNLSGITTLDPSINGNYSIKVEAEQYLPTELPLWLHCNPLDCNGCALDVNIDLAEKFCENRTLQVFVKDATNNAPLEGAVVSLAQETYRGPWHLGVYTADSNGEVQLPIIGNGHFTTIISMPGYLNLTSTRRVEVTPEECQFLAPMALAPMSTPLEPGCVRVSLTWGDTPKDLDLYSYRVHKYRSEDQCLTYYCDGKDPCRGIDFDIDNKEGGAAGSETITYCDVEAYSSMIWVDDRSGLGTQLLDSMARLYITTQTGTVETYPLRPKEGQTPGFRYWLAGCLTTTLDSYDFLPLNQLTSVQPNLEQPLHCHTRVTLNTHPSINAEVIVTVSDTKGRPLVGAMVSVRTESKTYNKLTGEEGQINLQVTEDGPYSTLVELNGYVPERLNFSLSCNGVEGHCGYTMQVTMLAQEPEGSMRIKMNWAGDVGRDLDLHLAQVGSVEPRVVCQTYWNNMAGCKDTELDHNMGAETGSPLIPSSPLISLAETIRIHDFAAKSYLTFLVFADDNTASGANFSIVQPQLTITLGTTVVTSQMPWATDSEAAARFWVAGCLEPVGTTFRFVSSNTWTNESPEGKAGIICDNLLGREVATTPPSFCSGTNLMIRVRDTQTDLPMLGNTTANVLRLDRGQEEMVWGGTIPETSGEIAVPISIGGHYVVKVETEGYITDRQEVDVLCSVSECSSCKPAVFVPLSPSLGHNQLRLVLGAEQHLDYLDMYSVYRDSNSSCVTIPGQHTSEEPLCTGVDHVVGDKGVETITFQQPTDNDPAVYSVFVKWTLPPGQEHSANFPNTQAWISLTNGAVTEDVYMDSREYGAERHWVAGCLMLSGQNTFEFRSLNVFFTERPDEEVPDLCLEAFGLKAKGLRWEGQCIKDKINRILPEFYGTTYDNTPEICKTRCFEKGFTYSGVQYGQQCYCGNIPPSPDDIVIQTDCNMACSGDTTKICGAGWRMNVYDTGFVACDCEYKSQGLFLGKGCIISLAAPEGYTCDCTYTGWGYGCSGQARQCTEDQHCPENCMSKTCCRTGGGDCGGYP